MQGRSRSRGPVRPRSAAKVPRRRRRWTSAAGGGGLPAFATPAAVRRQARLGLALAAAKVAVDSEGFRSPSLAKAANTAANKSTPSHGHLGPASLPAPSGIPFAPSCSGTSPCRDILLTKQLAPPPTIPVHCLVHCPLVGVVGQWAGWGLGEGVAGRVGGRIARQLYSSCRQLSPAARSGDVKGRPWNEPCKGFSGMDKYFSSS